MNSKMKDKKMKKLYVKIAFLFFFIINLHFNSFANTNIDIGKCGSIPALSQEQKKLLYARQDSMLAAEIMKSKINKGVSKVATILPPSSVNFRK